MLSRIVGIYRASFQGLPRQIWILAGIALVNRAGTMVFPFLSLYFTQRQGLDVVVAGRIISLYGVGAIVGAWVGGALTDRIGAMRTQQISLFLSGIGFLSFLAIDELVPMAIGGFILGAVVESFRPANMAAVSQASTPLQQPRAFGLLRMAVNIGMGIGPAVGGLLALYGYHWLFIIDATTCWIAALLLVFAIRGERRPERPTEDASPVRSPLNDGPFLALLSIVFLVAMLFFQVFTVLPLYLSRDLGFREDHVGLVLGMNALLIVLFEMPLTAWGATKERVLVTAGGAALIGLGLAMTPWFASVSWIYITVVVWTFGEMLCLPMFNAIIAGRADPAAVGRYMGMYTIAFSIAFVVAPSLGAAVYARQGAGTLWLACGAVGVVATAGCLALRRYLAPR